MTARVAKTAAAADATRIVTRAVAAAAMAVTVVTGREVSVAPATATALAMASVAPRRREAKMRPDAASRAAANTSRAANRSKLRSRLKTRQLCPRHLPLVRPTGLQRLARMACSARAAVADGGVVVAAAVAKAPHQAAWVATALPR